LTTSTSEKYYTTRNITGRLYMQNIRGGEDELGLTYLPTPLFHYCYWNWGSLKTSLVVLEKVTLLPIISV